MTLRMTYATALVLQSVADGLRYGFDVMDATGLPGGTVYPALRRLEAAQLLAGDWEEARAAQRRRRPPRRFYVVTPAGEAALADARSRFPRLQMAAPSALAEADS